MSTEATSSVSSANPIVYDPSKAQRVTQKSLNQEDFLKILVAQLAAQDPTNPVTDTDFVGQMAQFNSLEQTSAMQTQLAGLRQDQQTTQAGSMLGKKVTFREEKNSADQTGTVTEVVIEAGKPKIKVNGQTYEPSKLYSLSITNPESQPTQ